MARRFRKKTTCMEPLMTRVALPLLKGAFALELLGVALTVAAPHALFSAVVLAMGLALFAIGAALYGVRGSALIWGSMSIVAVAGAALVLISSDERPRGSLALIGGLVALLLLLGWRSGALKQL